MFVPDALFTAVKDMHGDFWLCKPAWYSDLCLLGTMVVSLAAYATQFIGPEAYNYLIGASGLCGFIAWLGIAISHFRLGRHFKQGHTV